MTKLFRVFICSSFEDMVAERRALHEGVFPDIRALCRSLGHRFQPIDLRWGVPEGLVKEHRTLEICLEEIRRCREISAGVHLLIILGDRYGWRPLPSRIPEAQFETLLRRASDPERLRRLWAKDENASPPEYRLRPRRDTTVAWQEEETRALTELAHAARNAPELTVAERIRFGRSATHQEIECGLLGGAELDPERAYAYFRIAPPRPADTSSQVADADDSHERLEELKRRVEEKLGSRRVFRYEADGRSGLEEFCRRVAADLRQAVEATARRQARTTFDDTAAHAAFAKRQAEHFFARSSELAAIARYVHEHGRDPLIVCGPPGCGRTALLARATLALDRSVFLPITRFVGATATSTEVTTLLASIVDEMRPTEGDASATPTTYREAVDQLQQALGRVARTQRVVIVIDGIDQLRGPYATNAGWLSDLVRDDVRVIISVATGAEPALPRLRADHAERAFLHLPPLGTPEASAILDAWLDSDGRTLQPMQRRWVLDCFETDRTPLSLRLAYEHARRLTSYDGVPHVPSGARGLLEFHLETLASRAGVGSILVQQALGYLADARLGLLEDETTAVLSRDSLVMDEVGAMHPYAPATAVLPDVLWSRFLLAVAPILGRASSRSGELLTIRGGLARELVAERTSGPSLRRHAMLASYFADEYASGPRDRPVPERVVDELVWQCHASGDRDRLVDGVADLRLLQATYDTQSELVHGCWRDLIEQGVGLAQVYGERWRRAVADGLPVWAVGSLLGQMGEVEEAWELTRTLVEWFRTRPESAAQYARAVSAEAQFLMAANRNDEATERYRLAERIFERLGNLDGLANVLNQLAGCQRSPQEALRLLERVEQLTNRPGNPGAGPGLLGNRARLLAALGRADDAVALERQAIELADAHGMTAAAADHRIALAALLHRSGRASEALALLERAETTVRRVGLLGPLAACLGTEANIRAALGDYDVSIAKNAEAEACLRRTGQLAWLAVNLFNQALLFERLGARSSAVAKARELVELSQRVSLPRHVRDACDRILGDVSPQPEGWTRRRWWRFWE